jgi:hypothetical protein
MYKGFQAQVHYGFVFVHSEAVQSTSGANPRGVELELIKQRVDTAVWNLCNCYPKKGWSFSYFNFDSKVLGHGFTTAYFLEPAYKISRKSLFRFRAGAGLSYLTNPYHPQKNPANLSYSTALSGFLQLGVGGSFQVAPRLLVLIGTQYQHISNAGFKEPNKGINWPTASIGVTWFRDEYNLPTYTRRGRSFQKQPPHIEAGVFMAAKQGYKPNGSSPRAPLAGITVQVEKRVGRISAIDSGVEIYYDNSLKQRLEQDSINATALRAGLLAGHNFLLGKFFFSQQLGLYIVNQSPYYNRLYHRWALRYLVSDKVMVGVGFKAHRHVADFFDVRLVRKFRT